MKRAKQIVSLLLTLIVLLCVTSCNTKSQGGEAFGATSAPVKKFTSYILDNEYADAIALYNSDISGNSELETEAAKCIEAYLSDITSGIFSGEIDNTDAEIKENTVKKVYSSTNCRPKNYDDLIDGIDAAFNSKVAYKSGVSLFESENYADAIAELSKVLPEDADYKDAVEKQAKAVENYKEQVMKEVGDCLSKNDYMQAIGVLKEGVEVLPDDADLAAEIKTCEKNYIAEVVSESETIFTDYTKYGDALKIIQSGLQNFPGNQTLIEKRDYYQSFAPVNLYDLEEVKGKASKHDTDTDTYKNEYEKCFWIGYSGMLWSGDTDIIFDLKGTYNMFSATVYGRSTKTDYGYYSVSVYGDGAKLYENTKVVDNGKAFDISVDVTGISEFRVVLEHYDYSGPISGGIGITDMMLQRTVK